MKAIASLFTALTENEYSHSSGFARIFSQQLHDANIGHQVVWSKNANEWPWTGFEEIYLYQGLDLNGKLGLNMFGGQCEGNASILNRLAYAKTHITPIAYPLLPYHELKKRDWSHIKTIGGRTWANLEALAQRSPLPIENPCRSTHLCIGDSHIPSAWKRGTHIRVLSGYTLHRALSQTLLAFGVNYYESATFYFGQIDVRHHLGRQPDPQKAAYDLAKDYVAQLGGLEKMKIHCEVALLHPIEDEARPIPGPGHYKGTPFFGSWDSRNELREMINFELERNAKTLGYGVYAYPREWHDANSRMDQAFMERPRSVHIAPKFYRAFR